MNLLDIRFWAGTQDSLLAYVEAVKRLHEGSGYAEKAAMYQGRDEERAPRLFSKQGEVGVISISGSLNNTDSWINEYIGATGYPEIRDALIYAATNDSIKAIVLDIKSGGGNVAGVSDTGELISMIDAKVKPVHAYSDGIIASAAYWLGSSARSLTIGKVTEAGSIGVLVVHQEQSKMLADMGITTTVIRSGKWKALGNPMEPLGDLGEETFQAQVNQLNDMFEAQVAENRSTTQAVVHEKMGQGRVFIGQDAVNVGLADAVSNFDAFMSSVVGGIDSTKAQHKYGANSPKGTQVKTALTEQQVAVLAAGGTIEGVAPVAAPAAEVKQEEPAEGATSAAGAAPAAEADTKPAASTDVVAMLQSQLAAANAQVVDLSVELRGMKDASVAASAAVEKMRPIVRAAVSTLRVALGGSKDGVDALADDSLVAEHAGLASQFANKFKAGGVAAVSSTAAAASTADATAEVVHAARIDAIRGTTNRKPK